MGKRPRVCIVPESYYPVVGGMERQVHAVASGLAARDLAPIIVTLRARWDLPRQEVMDGIEVHRVSWSRNRWCGIPPLVYELESLRDRYDILLVEGFRALGLAAVPVAWTQHKPVILASHNNGELSGEFFDQGLHRLGLRHDSLPVRPLNATRKAVLRGADRFIALSSAMRREFVAEGVRPERIVNIPNSVSLARFRPPHDAAERQRLRAALGLPQNGIVVCFCGRLVRWKGPLTVLEAWRSLRASGILGSEDQLLFLGAGGSDLENCEAEALDQAAAAGLFGSVRFLGDVANVEEYLRAADVFTLPTANDSFAIAVVEAMASGLPVITTTVSGLADYVSGGYNALVVQPNDTTGLAAALASLVHDASLRERLGKAGIRTAAQFSPEAVVERHTQLFEGLMS